MYDPSSPLLRSGAAPGGIPQPDAKARFAEDRLLDAVVWCEVTPGETITEADVMDRFGLTRAAARAALTRLGYDGWAQPLARLGWQVAPVTGALIGDILAARRIVEPALAQARLTQAQLDEVTRIGAMLRAVCQQPETGAVVTFRHFVDEIDGTLLGAIDTFTARHLRKLWHHSARITRHLENATSGHVFHRDDIFELVRAVTEGDRNGIIAARHALIDAQERFFMRQLLKSDTPIAPGSGAPRHTTPQNAATNRRPS
ncbi:putative transcriptional regulator (plasmid) [Paracoccaceae bacterium]|nr:putative transcriptional regulator [Paracoccaceae bacterium]